MPRVQEFLLRSLAAGQRTMWDLVAEQSSQHRRFTDALRKLVESGLVASDSAGNLRLTPAGETEARSRRLDGWEDRTCPRCAGRGVATDSLAELSERWRHLATRRPEISPEYDQGVVPAEVAISRLALMEQRGDLANKDILILGDDDLMSVLFALSGLPAQITVLEVDARVTSFLRDLVHRQGWTEIVAVVDYDVRQPLPAAFRGRFDVFFTDPVETVRGITLFLSRCVEALRGDGCSGYFGLTHLESGWRKWLELQRAAIQMNLVIAEALNDFSQYNFLGENVLRGTMKIVREAPVPLPPPSRLWYRSSLFRVQQVGEPKPLIAEGVSWGRELYSDEETI